MTVVKHIADSHDTSGLNTGRQELLYGTHNGVLGQLFLDHQTVKQGWQMRSDVHKGITPYASILCQNLLLRHHKSTTAAYDPGTSPFEVHDVTKT